MDGLGEVGDVAGGHSSDRHSAVTGSVNGELLGQAVNLLGAKAGVGEHADLQNPLVDAI